MIGTIDKYYNGHFLVIYSHGNMYWGIVNLDTMEEKLVEIRGDDFYIHMLDWQVTEHDSIYTLFEDFVDGKIQDGLR